MTKLKNIALAKRIIRKDCMIAGNNIDNDGNTCVIGALGLAAGISKPTMRRYYRCYTIQCETNKPMAQIITEKFGLTVNDLASMQKQNDRAQTIPARRKAVLAALDRIIKLRKQATKGSKCK